MSTAIKFRGGTTAQHSTFTGAAREITVDTTKNAVVVHDGATAGGFPMANAGNVPVDTHAAAAKASPISLDEFPLVDSAAGFGLKKITFAQLLAAMGGSGGASEQGLTQYFSAALDGNYRDLYRSGWQPAWFNQQWGGAQWGNLPDGSFGCVATGNVQDDGTANIGAAAAGYYITQGFKIAESFTLDAVWVKLYKIGNPAGNLTARVYSDNGSGSPNTALGSAAAVSCKLFTSKVDGEWYQITGLAAALTAGTQYHLVLTTGGVDASNYPVWKISAAGKYPHGTYNQGTSVPAWTPVAGWDCCFLIQSPAANALIQSGGMFDYKLAFAAGTPVDQSRALAQPLVNFYDGKSCTVLHRGTYAVSNNVFDLAYGIDHDRITVTVNASGFPVLTIYRSDRTAYTVTGTGSVTSGNHDVGIKARTVGDGADYAYLYVDGVSVGTPLIAQTFTMAKELRDLGTARLGDGFGLTPTWTQDMQMASLPSAQGWTWTGTATEANAMSIQNNKLYQNAGGYTSTQTGYYQKTTAFVNATGGNVTWKMRVTNTNGAISNQIAINIDDGTHATAIYATEYYVDIVHQGSGISRFVQGDFKQQDVVFSADFKGTDFYLYANGKLIYDGTGNNTGTTTANMIQFGDLSSSAGENADAIWSYLKYYQGGMVLPAATSGSCSEFAHWSGDRSTLFPSLWNGGTPKAVKEICGAPRNYQYESVVQRIARRGVINQPTTTSTSFVLVPDMEAYVLGGEIAADAQATVYASANANTYYAIRIDGVSPPSIDQASAYLQTSGIQQTVPVKGGGLQQVGLHKVEYLWMNATGNTLSNSPSGYRRLSIEARS